MKGDELSALIKKWGNAHSIALFDPHISIFRQPQSDGIIGYRQVGKCAVVFGDPVSPIQERSMLTESFSHHCQKEGYSTIYVPISSHFLENVRSHQKLCSIHMGYEVVLNPMINIIEQSGQKPRELRNKYNQAKRNAIIMSEYSGNDLAIEQALEKLMETWKKSRKGPQIFQQDIDLFAHRDNKRWFYSSSNDEIIGLIILMKIQDGWALHKSLVKPGAPSYISEAMILYVFEILNVEGCNHLSVGTILSTQLESVAGMNVVSKKISKFLFKMILKTFNLGQAQQQFWKKFNPTLIPMHAGFNGSRIRSNHIIALMRSFNVF